jgi:ORF6N domain
MAKEGKIVLVDQIETLILEIRGQKVLLNSDLAALYGVPTKRLNEQVRRNRQRFPEDFLFQLTAAEKAEVVANCDHLAKLKFSPQLPYAFTEHGTMMAAMILNSPRAVEVSVFVVRAFVKLRQFVLAHKELAGKLDQLEKKVGGHDDAIRQLLAAIRQLMAPPAAPPRAGRIGFRAPAPKEKET